MAGPPVPLSTLHPRCRHRRRMTRGQRGSLLLHCGAPSSPTLRRFYPGAFGQATTLPRGTVTLTGAQPIYRAHCNFLFMSTLPQCLRLDGPSGRSTGVESTSNNFNDFRPASATVSAQSGCPPAERGRRQPPTRATPFPAPISKRRLSHTPRTFLSPGESTTSILATPLLAPTWGIRVLKAKRPNERFPVLHFDAPENKGEQTAQPIQAPVGAE